MAYRKLLEPDEILKTALQLVESDSSQGLSLRAVATALGVKAPSLYRYFPQKEALEAAVAEEACRTLLAYIQDAGESVSGPEERFRATGEAYLRFAREHVALYTFLAERFHKMYGFPASKAVWDALLEATSAVSGQPDDTGAAVAAWSFLHGYAMLERSGAFGASGPRGGLERGLAAFLAHFQAGVNAGAADQKTDSSSRSLPPARQSGRKRRR
jgi:AcrR family transcriptional regulator